MKVKEEREGVDGMGGGHHRAFWSPLFPASHGELNFSCGSLHPRNDASPFVWANTDKSVHSSRDLARVSTSRGMPPPFRNTSQCPMGKSMVSQKSTKKISLL